MFEVQDRAGMGDDPQIRDALQFARRLKGAPPLIRVPSAGGEIMSATPPDGIPLLQVACAKGHQAGELVPSAVGAFQANGLRALVAQYYSAISHAAPPGFFRANSAINRAIAELLCQEFPDKSELRVREIGAGGYGDRWSGAVRKQNNGRKHLAVTLSDFLPPSVGYADATMTVRSEREDLYEEVAEIPEAERQHMLVATYVLDSLSFAGDCIVRKFNGEWIQALIGIRERGAVQFTAGAENEASYDWVCAPLASDFNRALLKQFADVENSGFINVPFGTARFVEQLVRGTLLEDGIMLIGEIGVTEGRSTTRRPVSLTHEGAPFCHCQMLLLADLLRARDLEVEVLPVANFARRYLSAEQLAEVSRGDREMVDLAQQNHGFMLVRQKRLAGAEFAGLRGPRDIRV